MTTYGVVVNVCLAASTIASWRRLERVCAGALIAPSVALGLAGIGVVHGVTCAIFATAQGFAWWGFVHLPIALGGWAVLARRRGEVAGTRPALGAAAAIAALGLWSWGIEPERLEVTHVAIPSTEGHMRIALLADIQTDDAGSYERRVIEAVRAEHPDLVLFAGDYVQVADNAAYIAQTAALARIIGRIDAPLGAWAVRGDVDGDAWDMGFADTDVHVVKDSATFALKQSDGRPFWLTALATPDSRSPAPPIPVGPGDVDHDGLHIVFGHAPDYALGAADAHPDLLLAGHTHGGQVQIPGFGPLITLTKVPRAWAAGVTTMPWGGTLIVSRGIGMERLEAPRLRFWCRPEIVIIDLG